MASLTHALLKAQQSIGNIKPDKKNSFANYEYVSAAKMVAECKKALNDAGLVFYASDAGIEFDDNGNMLVKASFVLHLACEDEDKYPNLRARVYNYTMPLVKDKKPDDKIVLGVRTTLLRYWLRDLLMIPCDDREDIDARPDIRQQPQSRKPPAQQPTTLGTAFARKMLAKMQDANLSMDTLRKDLDAPDESPDQWPKSFAAKVKEWIEERTPTAAE